MLLDLSIAVIITGTLIFLLIKRGYSLKNVNKLILNTSNSSQSTKKPESNQNNQILPGLIGVVKTPLRPSGKVDFEDNKEHMTIDVLSVDGHISVGEEVIVETVHGTKVTVKKNI